MYTTRAFHLGTLGRGNDDNSWFLTPQKDNTEKMFQEDYFNVSWETHSEHVRGILREMRTSNDFTDVTIICSDQIEVNAHRNILSAFSPTFRRIFLLDKCMNNPVIYLRGIRSEDIEPILQFIYLGETTIQQNRVQEFLTVAKELEIKDLVNIVDASGTVSKKVNNEFLRNVEGSDTFPPKPKYQNEKNDESYLGWLPLKDTFENAEDSSPKNMRRHPDRSSLKVMKKRYACDQCEFKSNVKERLQRHIQSEHEPPVKYSWGVGVVWKQ